MTELAQGMPEAMQDRGELMELPVCVLELKLVCSAYR